MKKMHTRSKRKMYMSSHLRHAKRPKTDKPKAFKSEEKALDWLKKHSITNFELRNIRTEGKPKLKVTIK
ncbi:hypothetical protein HYT57_04965 [Candidatus Woesearchaeota archaeon]|nr:hypothetical protein [Candidatus Woesearchaeota archaeon]